MTRVAIVAAMAGELKPLVRGWVHERRGKIELWRWRFDQGEWVAACGGAGIDAATRAFAEIEKDGAPDLVISVGWAGALSTVVATGEGYWVSGVIDARTGERYEVSAFPPLRQKEGARMGHGADADYPDEEQPQVLRLRSPGRPPLRMTEGAGESGRWLVTSPTVADDREKRRLAETYKAGLVDMEAAGIARLAQMRGIPFYCFKGVSDGFTDKLPDFNRFIRPDGQFDLTGMVLFSILRPWYWPSLVRMGENSKKASQSIREALLDFLDERAIIRQRNGYPNFKS
jgi:adenosylhomocysteine nucleosidase